MAFEENVLLKLKRQFSESETVSLLTKELGSSQFKIGELLSENAEMKDEIKKLNVRLAEKLFAQKTKVPLALKLDEYAADLKRQIQQQRDMKNAYKKELERMRNNYYSLMANK